MESPERGYRYRMPYDWPLPAQYTLALGAVGLSLLVRWSLDDAVGGGIPFSLTLGVLLVLVLLVRSEPFLLAAASGWLGAIFLFVPTRGSFIPAGQAEGWTLTAYTVVITMAVLTARLSRQATEARDRDQAALREGERRLRAHGDQLATLVDRAPLGVYLLDSDLRIVQMNPVARATFGETATEPIGKDFEDVVLGVWGPRYSDEALATIRRTLETGESYEMPERPRVRSEGAATEYYEWRVDRITLPDDRYGVVCYFRDVSDEVTARRAIVESEERYRTLFESIDQGFSVVEVIFDAHGDPVDYRFLETNPAFEHHTGLIDATGKRVRELVPDIEDRWVEVYGDVAATGMPRQFEDESLVMGKWFAVEAFRVGEPEENRVALLFEDITGRKRSEQALRESEERLRFTLEAADFGTWDLDLTAPAPHTARRSLKHDQIFGYDEPLPEWSYKSFLRHVVPEDRREAEERFRSALTSRGGRWELECRIRRADGEIRWIWVLGHSAPEGGSPPERMLGLVSDITERKQAEQALREADRRKDEFLATLAHELRNPLAAIRTALTVMELAGTDPAQTGEMRAIIDRQSAQLARLVDDLLDVTRITRGRIELRRSRIDVGRIIRDLVDDAGPMSEEAGIDLAMVLPDHSIQVDADPVRLSQVVNNLLQNAIKFTEPGGKVRVRLEREGEEAVIRVTDTGVGLSSRQLEDIFDMFSQVQDPLRRKGGGLGIGLALSRAIIVMHGGRLEATSRGLGRGSEFLVRLGMAGVESSASGGEIDAADRPESGGLRIVAADDNRDALDAVATMLRMKGHEVQTAANGAEALETARSVRPDVVLLDIGMPELDGYEVARRIRAEPWGSGILLLAMTGWGQDRDKALASEAGFDRHLTKPVDSELLDRVLAEGAASSNEGPPAS